MPNNVRVGGVEIDVNANLHRLYPDLNKAQRATERTGRVMTKEFGKAEAKALSLNKAVATLGGGMALLGVGFGLGGAVGQLADFSAKMKEVAALTGATGKQFADLEKQARSLGATTKFSASAAADAQGFLARAGYDVNEVLEATPQILTLAAAGSLELANAADIASNVLAGFNLEVAETGRVVDLLAKTANSSNSSVGQLGEALKFAAPSAVAFGLSVEETLATIGKLQDAGIQAGLAGRGFVALTTKFVQSKGKLTPLIGEYDLASEGLVGVIKKVNEANLSLEDSVEIFRGENLDALTVIRNAVENGTLKDLESGLKNSAGYAAALGATKIDQLQGDIQALASAAQEVVLAMGEEGLTGGLREVVKTATGAFRGLSENMGSVSKAAEVLAFILAATLARNGIGAVATNLVAIQGQLAATTVGMTRIGAAATLAANTLRGMWAAAVSPVGIAVIAGLAVGLAKIGLEAQTSESRIDALNDTLGNLDGVNKAIQDDTKTLKRLNDELSEAMESQSDIAAATATTEIDAINKRIAKNKELQQVYKAQAVIQLAEARRAVANEGGSLSRSVGSSLGLRETYIGPRGDERTRTRAANDNEIAVYIRGLQKAAQEGEELTSKQIKQLEQYVNLLETRNQIEAQSAIIDAIDSPVAVAQVEAIKSEPKKATKKEVQTEATEDVIAAAKEEIELNVKAIRQMERQAELKLAMASGDTKRVAELERIEDIERRTADYFEAGLGAIEARVKAIKEVDAELGAKPVAVPDNESDDDYWKEFGESASEAFSYGLKSAIQEGEWGDVFGEILMNVVDNAFSNAMDELFDELSKIDWTGNGDSGWGGFFKAVGSAFAGNRAGGGQVKAGMAYNVGELGVERFVPNVDGYIVPNNALTNGGANLTQVSNQNVVKIDVHGNLDNVTKEDLAATVSTALRKAVPPMVDQRVVDRTMRGAY